MRIVISRKGDRWDTLAYELLGDSAYAVDLMAANVSLIKIDEAIPEGIEIILPEILNNIEVSNNILPPWQR